MIDAKAIEEFARQGKRIRDEDTIATLAKAEYVRWVDAVKAWLEGNHSGLGGEWASLGYSGLSTSVTDALNESMWTTFRSRVNSRIDWLEKLPGRLQSQTSPPPAPAPARIDEGRIDELRQIQSNDFDLRRLIRLCEEINICVDNRCYLAVAALIRALLDHVPPVFGKGSFTQVANNYGRKSFKKNTLHLENSARNIADDHLHRQIGQRESLPTFQQVNFFTDLDVLLAEIIRILR